MNKKGFTLTELLGVIVVLAVIVSIAGISAVSIMNKSKNKLYREMEDNLKDVAVTYILTEYSLTDRTSNNIKNAKCVKSGNKINCTGKCSETVSVDTLKNEGLFEDNDNYCKGSITVNVICGKEKADGSIVEDYEAIVKEGTCRN